MKMKLALLAGVLLFVSIAQEGHSRLIGPPLSSGTFDRICNQMTPSHGSNTAQSGNGGYTVTTNLPRSDSSGFIFTAGQTYNVTLRGTEQFLGFLVIAHVPGENAMLLGRFVPRSNQQTLDCDGVGASPEAAVAHSNRDRKPFSSMTFTWEAPADANGTLVDFRYTVVRSFNEFYVQQSAFDNPGYPVTFRTPANCSQCDVFVGINSVMRDDSRHLDIYLEGVADGWVAVGFTKTRNMIFSDVVACNRNPSTDMVVALDAWNNGNYNNEIDTVQNVLLLSSGYSGGRITCSVSKRVASNETQDLDLNDDYYVIYGRRRGNSNSASLIRHEDNPAISLVTLNPVAAQEIEGGSVSSTFPKIPLLKFHGILMLVAWPVLALTGIFFATWMRPALPNGEWFQVHRSFLLASMFLGALGFAIAFIASYPNSTSGLVNFQGNRTGLAHFVIGIIVVILHIANPIIAIFRCKPTEKNRWIFNLIHGSIVGVIADALALTNIALGTSLMNNFYGAHISLFWMFIAFVIFEFTLFVVMVIIFTIKSCLSKESDRCTLAPAVTRSFFSSSTEKKDDTELKDVGAEKKEKEEVNDEPSKKEPSRDAYLRWIGLSVYLVITIPLMIACIAVLAAY